MFQALAHLRKWLAIAAALVVGAVSTAYWISSQRKAPILHSIPQQLGLDIQQSTDGFSISKSEGGRTLYTIRAAKAIQFKEGGRAALRDVHIVVYGRTHDRYDQIYGDEFLYDQSTGNIVAEGEVHIDLEGYAEGPLKPDQAPPDELKNPIHLLTHDLTFNQKTGIGQTSQVVEFRTAQASGSAKGVYFDSNANKLLLNSDVHIVTTGANAATITGTNGEIQKQPRQAVLEHARIEQPARTLTADRITMLFQPDNTVEHVTAEGNLHIESRGQTVTDVFGPHGDLELGQQNSLQRAIISNGARFETRGDNLTHGSADKFILEFAAENQPALLHLVKNAVVHQDPKLRGAKRSANQQQGSSQPMEVAAEQLDFRLEDGNTLKTGDTVGPGKITILPAPGGSKSANRNEGSTQQLGGNATTVATAGKFHVDFGTGNRIERLHGSPQAKIISSSPGQPDKTSVSQSLDVAFATDGGVEKLIQTGDFEYHEPSAKPDTGGRSAFADKATYTPADQVLVLNGSPRVIDGGTTTTATIIRINRQTGDAFAEKDVKTTYSELKPQPNGALLASSDPIHVTADQMNAHNQPGVARYSGNVRLWQGANIVRAPLIDFDNVNRTVLAQGSSSQPVTSLFVQQSANGKLTPIDVTAERLTYVDDERRARYTGNVFARSTLGTVSAQLIDIYLKPPEIPGSDQRVAAQKSPLPSEAPSKIDHMVAIGKVIVTEPNRRAVGDRLVYTADDGKYVLTGKSPSIFDAEHGTVWGDSLTFYSHDDRVLVESKRSNPTVTRARTSK